MRRNTSLRSAFLSAACKIMKNKLIVLSGPSGVGKGTIVNKLLEKGNFTLSVSCTTRPPRHGEKDGVSYFFIDKQKFESEIKRGGFLEYSNHFGNFYGTPKAFVEEKLKECNVILEIEVDGALQVKRSHPEALLIMIAPPDAAELSARLEKRGSETKESIANRLSRMDYELSKQNEYDYVVVNDVLERAVGEIESIINDKNQGEHK